MTALRQVGEPERAKYLGQTCSLTCQSSGYPCIVLDGQSGRVYIQAGLCDGLSIVDHLHFGNLLSPVLCVKNDTLFKKYTNVMKLPVDWDWPHTLQQFIGLNRTNEIKHTNLYIKKHTSIIWAASIMTLARSIPDILLQQSKADLAAFTASSTSAAPHDSKAQRMRPAKCSGMANQLYGQLTMTAVGFVF